jgi:hypothetical protein
MKTHLIKRLTTLLVITFSMPLLAVEKPKTKPPEKPAAKTEPKAKEDTYPLYGKVLAITSRTLTVVRSESEEAKESKYSIGASTEVVNGDKPATVEDVKIGQWVGGSVKKATDEGNDVVTKINLGVKQKKGSTKAGTLKPKKEPATAKKKDKTE